MNWHFLIKGTSWILGGQVVTRLSGMLTSIIVARFLGPEGLGKLSLVRDIGVIAIPLFTLGVSQAVVRAVSRSRGDRPSCDELADLLSTVILFTSITAVIAFLAMFAISGPVAVFYQIPALQSIIKVMAVVVLVSIPYEIVGSVLTGLEEFKALGARQLASAVLLPVVIISCVYSWGVEGAVIASGFVNLILLVILIRYLTVPAKSLTISLGRPSWQIMKSLFRVSLPLLGSILMMRPLNLIGSSLLVLHAGLLELGWFRVAYTCYGLTMVLPSALNIVLLPIFSKIVDADDIKSKGIIISRLIIILTLPIFVIGILFSGPVTRILFGERYVGATGVVALMLICGFMGMIVSVLETNVISQGNTTRQFGINIINALVFTGMAYLSVPLYAHWGLAATYLLTEFIALLLYSYLFVKRGRTEILRLGVPVVVSLLTLFFVFGCLIYGITNYFMLKIAMILASVFIALVVIETGEKRSIIKHLAHVWLR